MKVLYLLRAIPGSGKSTLAKTLGAVHFESDMYFMEGNEYKFDITKIKLITIDIEVASENGFPDVKSCQEELLAITIQDYATKEIITWGIKPFNNTQKNVTYHLCSDESDLLDRFIF